MCARVARFYHWKHDDILSLDIASFMEYHEALSMLQAQEDLMRLKIATATKYTKKDYDNFYNQLEKRAYPLKYRKANTEEEINRILGL